jgi:hypothetical protein
MNRATHKPHARHNAQEAAPKGFLTPQSDDLPQGRPPAVRAREVAYMRCCDGQGLTCRKRYVDLADL